MKTGIRICVVLTMILHPVIRAAEPTSEIAVLIYNYAAIPRNVLECTEAEASRIYQQAGIKIRWLDCPRTSAESVRHSDACQLPPARTWLALRILAQRTGAISHPDHESLGSALYPSDGSFPVFAYVFAQDAEQLANARGIRCAAVLGHVVTHELGHLLLGPGSHSTTGIMQCPWYDKQLENVAKGSMRFTSAEAKRMQANIQARRHLAP